MNKLTIFILVIVNIVFVQANEFVVQSFEKVENDLSARRYERKDVNDITCAIIKIRSDITKPFVFDANLGIEGDTEYKENNEIWVYVSEGERQLTIAKDGFVTLKYALPQKIDNSSVYSLVLKAKDNKVSVIIQSDPPDAEKFIDGESLGRGNNFEILRGQCQLEVRKLGFRSYENKINITDENTIFKDIKLDSVELVLVEIRTIPEGAKVFLNSGEFGVTNLEHYFYPGRYAMTLVKPGYQSLEKMITIEEAEKNIFQNSLQKNIGILDLKLSPANARLSINRKSYGQERRVELAPGRYEIRAEADGYYPQVEYIEINLKETTNREIHLQHKTGSIAINVNPANASIMVYDNSESIYQKWIGSKLLEDIPVGNYIIEASSNGFLNSSRKVQIKNGKLEKIDLNLLTYQGSIQQELFILKLKKNVCIGAGVGLTALAIQLKLRSQSAYSGYENSEDPIEIEDLYNDAKRYNKLSGISLGTGIVALVPVFFLQMDISGLKQKLAYR